MKTSRRFTAYVTGVLCFTLIVILWGAFVRATGAGAGCGSHWPLCNGELVPRAPAIETLIELSHRLSSSLLGFSMIGLVIWAYLGYGRSHLVWKGALWTLFFTVVEGLVGAVQVKLELVADNPSLSRALWQTVHLANTFLLVGAITLTLWWSLGGGPLRLRGHGKLVGALSVGLIGMLLIGSTGAIAALGNTLFPDASLRQGLANDFSPTAHFLIRLRIFHPLLAIALGAYLAIGGRWITRATVEPMAQRAANWLFVLFVAQLAVGSLNLVLRAPVWMQLFHLLMASLVWIALVALSAAVLQSPVAQEAAGPLPELAPQR